jgi:transposase-like protein
MAMHLMGSSKKGISAHQMHRMLGVTYKSAWFMCHRIREAMKDDAPTPLGGEGKSVQADETYIGNSSKRAKGYKKGHRYKEQIVALIEPKGKARVVHVKTATADKVREILLENADLASELHTDESPLYKKVGKEFADHKTVEHGFNQRGYYVGKDGQTTNAVENFFGIFKRGMVGTYHKCEAQHLQRYLTEFEFRFNNRSGLGVSDGERAARIAKGIGGKRLTYRPTNGNHGSAAVC